MNGKARAMMRPLRLRNPVEEEAEEIENSQNEGVLPTTSASRRATKPVCGGVEAYNERSLRVKYRNQGVQTSFYESTPSAQDLMGNTISPGAPESTVNARANIPDASVECDNRNASGLARILFKHFLGMQSVR